jgi:hypothetical protein
MSAVLLAAMAVVDAAAEETADEARADVLALASC